MVRERCPFDPDCKVKDPRRCAVCAIGGVDLEELEVSDLTETLDQESLIIEGVPYLNGSQVG